MVVEWCWVEVGEGWMFSMFVVVCYGVEVEVGGG